MKLSSGIQNFIIWPAMMLGGCTPLRSPMDHSKFSKVPLNTQLYHRGPYNAAKFLRAEFKISNKNNLKSRYVGRLYETYESSGPWANFVDVYDLNAKGTRVCSVQVGSDQLPVELANKICFPGHWIPQPYRKKSPKKFISNFLRYFRVDESECTLSEMPDIAKACWKLGKKSNWEYWLK